MTHGGRRAVPLVICSIFAVAPEPVWHAHVATFFCVHHVAAMERLVFHFKSRVAKFAILTRFFAFFLLLHSIECRDDFARQVFNVRRKNHISRWLFFAFNICIFTGGTLNLVSRLDTVESDLRSG